MQFSWPRLYEKFSPVLKTSLRHFLQRSHNPLCSHPQITIPLVPPLLLLAKRLTLARALGEASQKPEQQSPIAIPYRMPDNGRRQCPILIGGGYKSESFFRWLPLLLPFLSTSRLCHN